MLDELFRIGHRTGRLLDLQREMQGYWNDEMSRNIRSRCLTPHEISSKEMLVELKGQQDMLDESEQRLKQAESHMVAAGKSSAEMERHQKYSNGELNKSHIYMEQMYKLEAKALDEIKQALTLIDQANKAGM
jgi:hypothetical protein